MKKIFSILAVTAIIIILSVIFCSTFGEQNNPGNAGREVCIEWKEVNVREGYSLSKSIITTLQKGDHVLLTGISYEHTGGEYESWIQVKLKDDGTTGWIVTSAIHW